MNRQVEINATDCIFLGVGAPSKRSDLKQLIIELLVSTKLPSLILPNSHLLATQS